VNCVGPRAVYDEAKRYAEALTMAYHREFAVDTKIARIFNSILADEQVLYDDGTSFRRETVGELAERLEGRTALSGFAVPAFGDDQLVRSPRATRLVGQPPAAPCFEVTPRYGRTIRVTGDHSLFVAGPGGRAEPRRVEDLEVGDRVAIVGRLGIEPR